MAFFNPVGGFITDPEHLDATTRFLAPMDQTHTLTAGGTYRPFHGPAWIGGAVEYGSGTPMGHGEEHGHGDLADIMPEPAHDGIARVPAHATLNVSFVLEALRGRTRGP